MQRSARRSACAPISALAPELFGNQVNNVWAGRQLPLSYKTLPVTASHFDGTLEYNVHNLYSLYEVVATAAALQRLRNRRQFILTRCARRVPLRLGFVVA